MRVVNDPLRSTPERRDFYSKLDVAIALNRWPNPHTGDPYFDAELKDDILTAFARVYGCTKEQAGIEILVALREASNGIVVVHPQTGEVLRECNPGMAKVITITTLTHQLHEAINEEHEW